MHIVLVPGFWLGAWSWAPVTAALEAAGHTPHPISLPGMESLDSDRRGITLDDHIRFVETVIDGLEGDVVLVGHSGGGSVIHAVVDRHPDRIRHAVYVDSGPTPHGMPVNPDIPEVDGELPLPEWDFFDDLELNGLDDSDLANFRARAVPTPLRVARDPQVLVDERRFEVPATIITCTFSAEAMRRGMGAGVPYFAELPRIHEVGIVELPTGHWPQFSRPRDLAGVIAAAIR
jgi:pimeloyl-ACP methyl ester carboxylesterase